MMKRNSIFKIGILISLIPFIFGFIFYDKLPDTMAVHFSDNNTADGFEGKLMALYGIPAFMIVIYIITYYFTLIDPRKSNQNNTLMNIILLFLPLLSVFVNGTIIYINLGNNINIVDIMNYILGILFLLLGNYLPKVKRNYTLGIKLPWTLDNDYIWDKTHRMGGYVFITGGIGIIIVSLFLGEYKNIIIPLIIGLIVVLPIIYSLILYKSILKK